MTIGSVLMLAATLSADFGTTTGKIRPELHSSGFGPYICSFTQQAKDDILALNMKAARTHDWALINPNERVCDYFHVFPLMDKDATDPSNYYFEATDYLLRRTREEMGMDVFYRLGTSIEHSGWKTHINSRIPKDFDKVAEIFAATVRHYNRGWANGYHWNIRYWEIWNEAENIESMWAPDVVLADLSPAELEAKRVECRKLFAKFFVTCLRRLKDEFGDSIKVGGPAHTHYNLPWFKEELDACRAAGIAPDFISWHGYEHDPMQYNRDAEKARLLCDSYGFTKCELIVNEWHYFGKNNSWQAMQHCDDPVVKARIWDGPYGHNSIHGSCFTLATLANMQRSLLSQAYYYGCRHVGDWGFKDSSQKKYKVYHGLRLFGEIVRDYTEICASESKGNYTTFAVKNARGGKGLLIVDYGGGDFDIDVAVKGVSADAKARCVVHDNGIDLAPHPVAFENGTIHLRKNDFTSAAFFVTFE